MRLNPNDIAVDNLHEVEERMRDIVRSRKMNQTGRLVRTKTKKADGSDAAYATMLTKALLTGKVSGTIDTKGRRVKASVVYPRGSFEYSAAKNYLFKGPMSTAKSVHKITVLDVVQKYLSSKNLCQDPVLMAMMKQKDSSALQVALGQKDGVVTFSKHCTSNDPLPDMKSWIAAWRTNAQTNTWVTAVLHYYFGQVFNLKGKGVMAKKIYSQIENYINDAFLVQFAQHAAKHSSNSGRGRTPDMVVRICKKIQSTLSQAAAARGGTPPASTTTPITTPQTTPLVTPKTTPSTSKGGGGGGGTPSTSTSSSSNPSGFNFASKPGLTATPATATAAALATGQKVLADMGLTTNPGAVSTAEGMFSNGPPAENFEGGSMAILTPGQVPSEVGAGGLSVDSTKNTPTEPSNA